MRAHYWPKVVGTEPERIPQWPHAIFCLSCLLDGSCRSTVRLQIHCPVQRTELKRGKRQISWQGYQSSVLQDLWVWKEVSGLLKKIPCKRYWILQLSSSFIWVADCKDILSVSKVFPCVLKLQRSTQNKVGEHKANTEVVRQMRKVPFCISGPLSFCRAETNSWHIQKEPFSRQKTQTSFRWTYREKAIQTLWVRGDRGRKQSSALAFSGEIKNASSASFLEYKAFPSQKVWANTQKNNISFVKLRNP